MNRFEPATPEQLSPSPLARKGGLDPVWELGKRADVSKNHIYFVFMSQSSEVSCETVRADLDGTIFAYDRRMRVL